MRFIRSSALLGLCATALTAPAHALTITATFDSSITSLANAAQVEGSITAAVDALNGLYSNAGTIPVLFTYDGSLGGGAMTSNVVFAPSYNSYLSALQAQAAANPGNTPLATALAHLPASGSVSQSVAATAAFRNLVMGAGLSTCFTASGGFNCSTGQYAAMVAVSAPSTNVSAFYASSPGTSSEATAAAEHELDEVLGGGGAGSTVDESSTDNATQYGTLDFYRYLSGNGTDCTGTLGARTWNGGSNVVSCFSINGGASAILDAQGNPIGFNQTGGGADYGDFADPTHPPDPNIQDAYEQSTSPPIYTASSVEAIMMQAIGYQLVQTNSSSSDAPEPATLALFGTALAGLAAMRRRVRG